MKAIKKVVIYKNANGSYYIAHTLSGLINPFAEFKSENDARNYAKEKGYKITK